MVNLFFILYSIGWLVCTAFVGFAGFMILQLIAFQVFGKNPYKRICQKLQLN